jgi:hypothetical protein
VLICEILPPFSNICRSLLHFWTKMWQIKKNEGSACDIYVCEILCVGDIYVCETCWCGAIYEICGVSKNTMILWCICDINDISLVCLDGITKTNKKGDFGHSTECYTQCLCRVKWPYHSTNRAHMGTDKASLSSAMVLAQKLHLLLLNQIHIFMADEIQTRNLSLTYNLL